MRDGNGIVQAKDEFVGHLEDIVIPVMINRLFKIYNAIIDDEERQGEVDDIFRDTLNGVDEWSDTKIGDLASEVQSRCGCVDEMIAAIFVAMIRICTVVRAKKGSDQSKIKIKLPPWKMVIHNVFRRCCQKVVRNRRVFSEITDDSDLYEHLETLFRGICARELSKMLPISDIVRYVSESGGTSQQSMFDDEEEEEEEGFETDEEVQEEAADEKIIGSAQDPPEEEPESDEKSEEPESDEEKPDDPESAEPSRRREFINEGAKR